MKDSELFFNQLNVQNISYIIRKKMAIYLKNQVMIIIQLHCIKIIV